MRCRVLRRAGVFGFDRLRLPGRRESRNDSANFPSLTLEQVYGAIAFYLGHQAEIDANIRQGEEEVHRLVPPLSQRKPEAYARLQRARELTATQ